MIGPAGCGKSTFAAELAEEYRMAGEDVVILSSDAIREELYGDASIQDNPAKVFNELHKRLREELKDGRSVIYDATNLVRARRVEIVSYIMDNYPDYICTAYEFNTTLNECIQRQTMRDRQVPAQAIARQFRQYEVALRDEGWDCILRV